jgi:high affinity Mn2+ porin
MFIRGTSAELRQRLRACLLVGLVIVIAPDETLKAQLPANSATPSPSAPTSLATNGNGSDDASSSNGADAGQTKEDAKKDENFNIFGQGTVIADWHGPFRSPYSGPHSFQSVNEDRISETATLFMGLRVCDGGEVYFNPEIAGGRGDSDVFGIAAFPNGDISRVGAERPTPYVARLYLRQTIGFGGEQEKVESGPNQLAETRDVSRLTFTFGKMAATDWFDNNSYAHDPRGQFMNWALMDNVAWDFPADVRGYSLGGVIELNQKDWAIRYGIFAEPEVVNGAILESDFGKAHGQVAELEQRYQLRDHPGKIRWLLYLNRADMGNYREATNDPAFDLDITKTRSFSSKYGYGVNLEQELTKDLGTFLRWGWDDGQTETWAFTECDRTISLGLVLKGTQWNRKDDVIGTAVAIDGLSSPHRNYLAAGGLGFQLGDGKLNYASEVAFESYYDFKFQNKQIWVTPAVQLVGDPGYNQDRGPVVIGAVRIHAEF